MCFHLSLRIYKKLNNWRGFLNFHMNLFLDLFVFGVGRVVLILVDRSWELVATCLACRTETTRETT